MPGFALNNLLSNVPLLGPLLTGGKDGGLFADLLSALDGPLDDLKTDVNMMSAMTPGALRELFIAQPTPPAAPSPEMQRAACRSSRQIAAAGRRAVRKNQTARTSTWRLRPAESFSVPDESRSPSLDRRGVGGDRLVVQPPAAALDQLARLGAALGQAGLVEQLERGDAGGELRARHADGRQRVGLARLPRRCGAPFRPPASAACLAVRERR